MTKIAVDGSFDGKQLGVGIVICNSEQCIEKSINITKQTADIFKPSITVAEFMAVLLALKLCQEMSIDEVEIIHDYSIIQSAALGLANSNSEITQYYSEQMNKFKDEFKAIKFSKHKAHSKSEINKRADRLAKDAIQGFI